MILAPQGEMNYYRKWPAEFIYNAEDAPKGHLPLTNALRGTQLLEAILEHPGELVTAEVIQIPLSPSLQRGSLEGRAGPVMSFVRMCSSLDVICMSIVT